MLDFINLYQRTYSNLCRPDPQIKGVIVPYGDYTYYLGSTISVFNPFWNNKNLNESSNVVLILPTNRIKTKKALLLGNKKWKTPLGEISCDLDLVYKISKELDDVRISELNVNKELALRYILPLICYYNVHNAKIIPIAVSDEVSDNTIANILKYVTKIKNTYFIVCGNVIKRRANLSSQPIIDGIVSSLVDNNIKKLGKLIQHTSFPNCFMGMIRFCIDDSFSVIRNQEVDDYIFRIRSKRLLGAISFVVKKI